MTSSFVSACCVAAACALLALSVFGCASTASQGGQADSLTAIGGEGEIEGLPTQAEYAPPDPASRGKVHVQVPEGYECSDHTEVFKPQNSEEVEVEGVLVNLGDMEWLLILVDDAGFFDWWYGGSMYGTATAAEYVDAAKDERFNSSWPISVDGHDGIVLITGSAAEGGEMSGDAFVFLDEATISFSAVLPIVETPAADAYSRFFQSEEVVGLLSRLTITMD